MTQKANEKGIVLPFTSLQIEIDTKILKKKQQIQKIYASSVAWGELSPLLFIGISDSQQTLYSYVPSSISDTISDEGDIKDTTYNYYHHLSYKYLYHFSAQIIDSWRVMISIHNGSMILYTLPLQTNTDIRINDESSYMVYKSVPKNYTPESASIVSDTKQTFLYATHERSRTVLCIDKQQVIKVFSFLSGKLHFRVQHDLIAILHYKGYQSQEAPVLPLQQMILTSSMTALFTFKQHWCIFNIETGELIFTSFAVKKKNFDTIHCAAALENPSDTLSQSQCIDDLFLGDKSKGYILTTSTTFKPEHSIKYNSPPIQAHSLHPFLLLSFSNHTQVYHVARMDLMQTLPTESYLTGCTWTSASNLSCFLSLSSNSAKLQLWKLNNIQLQAQSYINAHEYAKAAAFFDLSDCGIPKDQRREVYRKLSYNLFHSQSIDDNDSKKLYRQFIRAGDCFLQAEMDFEQVLKLFPSQFLPRQAQSQRLKQENPLQISNPREIQKILAFIAYLKKYRAKIAKNLTLDTVLFKCYIYAVYTSPQPQQILYELSNFLSNPNSCDLEETEWVLRTHDQLYPLFFFHCCRKQHRKALELLPELENREYTGDRSFFPAFTRGNSLERTVSYLQTLKSDDSDLIFEYSRHILLQNPALGLQIFIEHSEPNFDPLTVTNFLLSLSDSRSLAISYLTQRMERDPKSLSLDANDLCANLLLEAVYDAQSDTNAGLTKRIQDQQGQLGRLRADLLAFLSHSQAMYRAERILSRTRPEMMEERAALLCRLARHCEVLHLFVNELQDLAKAEAYCETCYNGQMYTALLALYLQPSIPLDTAVQLVNCHAERMQSPNVLHLLPEHIPIASLAPFFTRVFENEVKEHRNGQIQLQLAKMENFKVLSKVFEKRRASIIVWSSQCCQICEKKLGLSAFVRLPSQGLVHYACHRAET